MFTKFYDALYMRLTAFLTPLMTTETDPVKRLAKALQKIRSVLTFLRSKVLSVPFPSSDIEICFFKYIKPKFYAQRMIHFELYNLDMNKPAGPKKVLLQFYRDELAVIERFFRQHAFIYRYYKHDLSEMDHLYFLRGAEIPSVLEPEHLDSDREFSTGLDHLFARFIALEALQEEIMRRIDGLDGAAVVLQPDSPMPVPALKWTGSAVNLVELIYGLYLTGQLNNGNAEVIEIAGLMEYMFGFKLKDAHDTFGDIRERKVISPTRFLESMVAAVKQRIDDDLAFKPKRNY